MSSPISSLKKSKRSPMSIGSFPSTGHKNVPYRNPGYTAEESLLFNQITNNTAPSRLSDVRSSLALDPMTGGVSSPSPSQHAKPIGKTGGPSDNELMGLMMTRLAGLEGRVSFQAKEIQEKDKKIKILEEKIQLLQKSRKPDSYTTVSEFERKCLLLQEQIQDMEDFLADYGMVWVGGTDDPESDVYHVDHEEQPSPSGQASVWKPNNSLPGEFCVDYDLIIKNIEELNALAGEGVGQVQHTVDGARIKMPETIPLALYSNGIVVFSGPFRPFEDVETQQCLQDIMDGYFPSELQVRFPEGVPFFVTDRRTVYFKDKTTEIFKGSGQTLGGEKKPSRLVPSKLDKYSQSLPQGDETEDTDVETKLPGHKLSVEQFLHRLPQNVIKQGKVIDIRSSVGQAIHGTSGPNKITVVDTEAVQEMKERLGYADEHRPPTGKYTTLRIKDETGENTYILKMRFRDTIGSVRQHLTKQRPRNAPPYAIMSTFPSRAYDDFYATLQDCGLVPNATLHLKATRK